MFIEIGLPFAVIDLGNFIEKLARRCASSDEDVVRILYYDCHPTKDPSQNRFPRKKWNLRETTLGWMTSKGGVCLPSVAEC